MERALHATALWLSQHILPHEPDVRRWLDRINRAGLETDDIIQECYTRIVESTLANIREPRAYLFTTARNIIISHLRRRVVVRIDDLSDADWQHIEDCRPSPEDDAASRMMLGRITQAIELLPATQREILTLRKIEGLSQKEVAQRVNLNERQVERLMAQGLKTVQESMDTPPPIAELEGTREQSSSDASAPKGLRRRRQG